MTSYIYQVLGGWRKALKFINETYRNIYPLPQIDSSQIILIFSHLFGKLQQWALSATDGEFLGQH